MDKEQRDEESDEMRELYEMKGEIKQLQVQIEAKDAEIKRLNSIIDTKDGVIKALIKENGVQKCRAKASTEALAMMGHLYTCIRDGYAPE